MGLSAPARAELSFSETQTWRCCSPNVPEKLQEFIPEHIPSLGMLSSRHSSSFPCSALTLLSAVSSQSGRTASSSCPVPSTAFHGIDHSLALPEDGPESLSRKSSPSTPEPSPVMKFVPPPSSPPPLCSPDCNFSH